MGVRRQLKRLLPVDRSNRALHERSIELERQVASLTKEVALLRDRQLDEFDKMRAAVGAATDDLMARVDALREQIGRS